MKFVKHIARWIGSHSQKCSDLFISYDDPIDPPMRLIYTSLLKMIIENKANLHTCEFIMDKYNNQEFYCEITLKLILQNSNFVQDIKNLKLSFNFREIETLLKFLNSNCKSISRINFLCYDNNDNNNELLLQQMINSKQNLTKIIFEKNSFSAYNLLLLKNSNCSNTLKTVIFYKVNFKNMTFLNKVFEQLNVLEYIHILYCTSLNQFIQQIIGIIKPFKLKSLFMGDYRDEDLLIESIQLLFQKSGKYLEYVKIGNYMNRESKQKLLELIKYYCTKIKFFELFYETDHYHKSYEHNNIEGIYLALDLIKNMKQSLSYLSITSGGSKSSLIVLLNFGQILPSKLEYLHLEMRIDKISNLELFIRNSKNTFIKKLMMNIDFLVKDILPCIKEYIMKEKRVKYLAIEGLQGYKMIAYLDSFIYKEQVASEIELYNIKVRSIRDLYIEDYQVCELISNE